MKFWTQFSGIALDLLRKIVKITCLWFAIQYYPEMSVVGMLNSFSLNIRSSFANIRILFEVRKWPRRPGNDAQRPPPLLHHLISHPAGGPRQTKRQSPTGVSPPPHHNQHQQQASNNWLKRPRPSPNDCITLCGILWCGRRCEALWWMGWTGLDGRASRLRLNC